MASKQTTSDDKTAVDASFDDRDVRALTEYMTTIPLDAPGMFSVTTQSGSEYTVDARGGSCSCPDAEHRDITCKHIRRVRFAVGRRAIPDWADSDAIDDQLGEHVTGGPVMADGGRLFSEHDHGRYETEATDAGHLVWDTDIDKPGKRLAGFVAVEDWDAMRDELIRRGIGVGAIHHKEVFEPAEVGL